MIDTDSFIKQLSKECQHSIALWKLNTEQRFGGSNSKKCTTKTIYLSVRNKPSDLLQCSDMELMYS